MKYILFIIIATTLFTVNTFSQTFDFSQIYNFDKKLIKNNKIDSIYIYNIMCKKRRTIYDSIFNQDEATYRKNGDSNQIVNLSKKFKIDTLQVLQDTISGIILFFDKQGYLIEKQNNIRFTKSLKDRDYYNYTRYNYEGDSIIINERGEKGNLGIIVWRGLNKGIIKKKVVVIDVENRIKQEKIYYSSGLSEYIIHIFDNIEKLPNKSVILIDSEPIREFSYKYFYK